MKRVFRSILDIHKNNRHTIDPDDLKHNYRAFLSSRVEPEDPSFIKIYHWIEAHFRDFEQIPMIELIYEKAESEGDEAVLAVLKNVIKEQPYIGSNYRAVLKEKFEEQSKEKFQQILTTTWKIASTGIKEKKKTLKGIDTALRYFSDSVHGLRIGSLGIKTESDIRSEKDGVEVSTEYKKRKESSLGEGMYTFFDKIDEATKGCKPGHVWLVAGFVAQGKSIMSANLAYNAVLQGLNGLFIPMEMDYNEMRDLFYVLHASCPEWYESPKYKHMAGNISYEKVRYGELSEEEEKFFDVVIKDFSTNPNYGQLYLYQPSAMFSPANLELKAYEAHSYFMERDRALDFIIPDYLGLMNPDKVERYGDFNIDLNGIIKRMKNLAQTFDNGRQVRIISPFQINRQGFKEGEKTGGVFPKSALSNANEAERTCDLVMTLYMSKEMKKAGVIKIDCMKHRHGPEFDLFEAQINFSNRRIVDFMKKKSEHDPDDLINEIPV